MTDLDVTAEGPDRGRLRSVGRKALGVGSAREIPPLEREALASIASIGLLSAASQATVVLLVLFRDDLGRATGITTGGFNAARALLLVAAGALSFAAMVRVASSATRTPTILAAGAANAFATFGTGFVSRLIGLGGLRVVDAAGIAGAGAAHLPAVADVAGLHGRVRGMTLYRAVSTGQLGLLCALSWVLVEPFGFTARFVLIVAGLIAGATVVLARLRIVDRGDRDAVTLERALVAEFDAEAPPDFVAHEAPKLTDALRRVMLVPGARRILALNAVLGLFTAPFLLLTVKFLTEFWGMTRGGRIGVVTLVLLLPAAGLAWFGRQGEQAWQVSPALLVDRVGIILGVGGVSLIVAAFVPSLALAVVLLAVAAACAAIAQATLDTAMMTVITRPMWPHAAGLTTVAAAIGGGLVLSGVAGAIDGRSGAAWGLALIGAIAACSRWAFSRLAAEVEAGVDRQIDLAAEEVRTGLLRASGGHVALLACRGIDFSYGPVQVLFDVDFTVDEGEMVALLGTNGAGKSTLLRVISGIGYPTAGSVRFRGADITMLEATKRVGLGITQIPGGKAAFGSMTVLENLRLNAYSLGNDRAATTAAIERSFEAFPRLDERRHQSANTLSGGERQMLALSKALMLDPKLLLIDELSLGLAPVVVAELLERVRHINASGTAVVLVEQSVNVALSLVDHAYFMEKGEVRFDGPADELMDRPDIVRSVFLEGAARGLAGS